MCWLTSMNDGAVPSSKRVGYSRDRVFQVLASDGHGTRRPALVLLGDLFRERSGQSKETCCKMTRRMRGSPTHSHSCDDRGAGYAVASHFRLGVTLGPWMGTR